MTATRFWECCANHVVVDRCRIITAWGASMVHPCISPKGLGRLWTLVDGCGRWWTVVGGCGRLWTVVDGSLARFIRIQNETQQDVAKNILKNLLLVLNKAEHRVPSPLGLIQCYRGPD